jgi:hypothetical protein
VWVVWLRVDRAGNEEASTMHDNSDRGHERLWSIAGEWTTDGHVVGDPPVPVRGTDIYDVLAGGYFLVHHVDVTVGDQAVRAIEVIGEPAPEGGGFLARSFDDQGNAEVMRLTVGDDGVFHFTGGPDIAAAAQPGDATIARVRSTLSVTPDRGSMMALWERSQDGHSWEPWMYITFARRQ